MRQVEYYFSADNWPSDRHMQARAQAHGGYFPLGELVRFAKMVASEWHD